jgi:hypothetical protein
MHAIHRLTGVQRLRYRLVIALSKLPVQLFRQMLTYLILALLSDWHASSPVKPLMTCTYRSLRSQYPIALLVHPTHLLSKFYAYSITISKLLYRNFRF